MFRYRVTEIRTYDVLAVDIEAAINDVQLYQDRPNTQDFDVEELPAR